MDKLQRKYGLLSLYSKNNRLKKKAFKKLVELSGFDGEGLTNYAKAANVLIVLKK